jgi:DNA-binding phage protein
MARFTKERLAQFQDVDEVMRQYLSAEDIAEAEREADDELAVMRQLQEALKEATIEYLTKNKMGVPDFTEKLQTSTRQTYRILNGEANVTLATLAHLSHVIGKRLKLVFE